MSYIRFSDAIEEIPVGCFHCVTLNELNFPKSLKIIRSGNSFFANKSYHITLPEGVEVIESDAFCGECIDSIYIPSTVYHMDKEWYFEYPVYEEGEIKQPKIELSPDNPYFHLKKGKLVHNYVPNEASQKEYSKKVLDYIDSISLRDYLKTKDLLFTPQEMIAIAIHARDKRIRRISWFLNDLENATFLTETDRLYLQYEQKRDSNNWRQLNTNWPDRYIIAYGKNERTDEWKKIKKFNKTYLIGDEGLSLFKRYKYLEIRQYYTKNNEETGRYALGKYGVAEDCCTYIDIEIPKALQNAIRKEKHLPKNTEIDWTYMLFNRYIELPISFKKGDVVTRFAGDDWYVVTDANLLSSKQKQNRTFSDMAITVVPYKYKDYIWDDNATDLDEKVKNAQIRLNIFQAEFVSFVCPPNKKTIQAIEDAEQGRNLTICKDVEELVKKINE